MIKLQKDYDITGVFFNPNIHPYKEYLDRKKSVLELGREFSITIREEDYPYESFLEDTIKNPNEPGRCHVCYTTRLKKLKQVADQLGFQLSTTSLLYSIYQKHDLLLSIASTLFEKDRFLPFDFRAEFWSGVTEAKNRSYYRQSYCGCIFSNFERYYASSQK